MNALEYRMVDALKDLKENHHVVGIKAEFEAEGTRMEEALRLKEVITKAGLDLTIKIGGCEAIRDMYDARSIGVNRIVAPMIESAYALKKYLQATHIVYPQDEWKNVNFLINVETIDGFNKFDEMMKIPNIKDLAGVVLGRVDMTGSLGMTREDINSERIFQMACELFVKARQHNLECVIGGGVSAASIEFFNRLPVNGKIHHYETRKVIFECPAATGKDADKGILKAVGFELMWLKNKRDFYKAIFEEDATRIDMLQNRYDKLIEQAGGSYQ
ncbi:MAG: aldolase/citrate lyase family protein [Bacteroidota bacterium]